MDVSVFFLCLICHHNRRRIFRTYYLLLATYSFSPYAFLLTPYYFSPFSFSPRSIARLYARISPHSQGEDAKEYPPDPRLPLEEPHDIAKQMNVLLMRNGNCERHQRSGKKKQPRICPDSHQHDVASTLWQIRDVMHCTLSNPQSNAWRYSRHDVIEAHCAVRLLECNG